MVVVRMPDTFTNEEYADMHFVCGVCNGSGKALWWNTDNIPLCKISHHKTFENMHRTLRVIGSFPQANPEHE
jgi:hypothetical protein